PRVDRVARRRERDRLPVQPDLAGVRAVEPVQDVHQRRLARAVLPEQRVHFAAPHVERDVVVGDDAWKLLADPLHLEDEVVGHEIASYEEERKRAGPKPALDVAPY